MYTTAIDEFFDQGHKVAVCVWNKYQIVPAKQYIKAAMRKFPKGDACIIVTRNPKLCNGDIRKGRKQRRVIRYAF